MSGREVHRRRSGARDAIASCGTRLARLPGVDGRRRRLVAAAQPDDGVGADHRRRTDAAARRDVHQRRSAHRRRRLLPRDGDPAAARAPLHRAGHARRSRASSSSTSAWRSSSGRTRIALGKRIRTGGIDASATAPWLTVVGVVGRVKQDALDARLAHGDVLAAHAGHRGAAMNVVAAERAAIRRRWRAAVRQEIRDARSRPADLQRADDGASASTSRWRGGASRCCC